jgi:hypothetical protein
VKELLEIWNKHCDDTFEELRKDRKDRCATLLIAWVTANTTKRPIPDLPQRIEKFSKDITRMCDEMRIKMEKGTVVVKVNGSAEQTFKKLRLGTDWFLPCAEELETIIMAGLSDQFGS